MSIASASPSRSRTRFPLEAVFRAVLSDTEQGVLVLDPAGRVHAMNGVAGRILGIRADAARERRGDELVRTVVPGDDPVADAFRTPRFERETVLVRPDGVETPVTLRGHRVGRPSWVVLVLHDLTLVRRMQQDLRRNERLVTLGQLSAGLAHEIRNPLTGIGTSAQVLLNRFEPRDERRRFVQVVLDEVARLDRLVSSMLQYARPRVPELRPTQLLSCVERVRELTAERVADAGLVVELDTAPRARLATLYMDPDLVTQVLLNVTLNAVEATPAGGALRYELRRVRRRRPPRGPGRRAGDPARRAGDAPAANGASGARADAGWIEYQQVRVVDTGPGIPRHLLPKLFDPFFSTKPRGTGLGLAICQTIMQEHGGTIEIASREGRGTAVLLSFPVEKRHGERRESDRHAERQTAPRR